MVCGFVFCVVWSRIAYCVMCYVVSWPRVLCSIELCYDCDVLCVVVSCVMCDVILLYCVLCWVRLI